MKYATILGVLMYLTACSQITYREAGVEFSKQHSVQLIKCPNLQLGVTR
jgi:hypothetical protein